MKTQIDWSKVRFVFLAFVLAVLCAYVGQPLIQSNEEAVNVIVTVFSVLAGFLIAIIAVVGDPVLLPPGTWRAAEMERSKLNGRLLRHKYLFIFYLLTLALIFISMLLKKTLPEINMYLEYSFLFFGTFAFILSMTLPGALIRVQQERIDAVIEHRRNQDHISDRT